MFNDKHIKVHGKRIPLNIKELSYINWSWVT